MRSRRAAKSTTPGTTMRLLGFAPYPSFRVALYPLISGVTDLSAALALELAVVAVDTGRRGRELRSGGEVLGGGADM